MVTGATVSGHIVLGLGAPEYRQLHDHTQTAVDETYYGCMFGP